MDYRELAAAAAAAPLSSQLLAFPSPPPKSLPHHFLSTASLAASLIASSNKRKRNSPSPRRRVNSPVPTISSRVVSDSDRTCSDVDRLTNSPSSGRVGTPIPTNPDSFTTFFNMKPSTFEWLCSLLEPLLECRDPAGSRLNLTPDTRLGIGLCRLATGSDYPDISTRFRVPMPVAKFCVRQLCRVLCTNFRFWVGFPGGDELKYVSNSFEELTGLPNCCGVVDCARFKFVNSSSGEEENVAAQIVVDSSCRILNIFAGFKGDKGDSLVLESSSLYKDIKENKLLNSPAIDIDGVCVPQYLVGDGGYPLLPWLLTPFAQPTPKYDEENFNRRIDLMRLSALKTIASLKNWGVLRGQIEVDFKTLVGYVGACSILHNALLIREDHSGLCDEFDKFSAYDESSPHYSSASVGNLLEKKASDIRSALAARARNFSE